MGLDLSQYESQALTVSDFIAQTNGFFERLGQVLIKGEISQANWRNHLYFDIKDEHGLVSCLIYKSVLDRLEFKPEVGQQVLIYGKNSIYPKNGSYKLIVANMSLSGLGQIMKRLELLDQKLYQEGVYARARPLPSCIENVAVVTSREGRVIDDIRATVLRRNHLVNLYFFDTKVQGPDAPNSLVQSLNNAYSKVQELKLDVIIVGRGGGSFEDLLCFSDEQVVRTVAQSPVPIISAVGHHEDAPLCDKAADLRASTPTAAAEIVTNITYEDRVNTIDALVNDLDNTLRRMLDDVFQRFDKAALGLQGGTLLARCQAKVSQIDYYIKALDHGIGTKLASYNNQINALTQALEQKGVRDRMYLYQSRIDYALNALHKVVTKLDKHGEKVALLEQSLHSHGNAILVLLQNKQAKSDYLLKGLSHNLDLKFIKYHNQITNLTQALEQKGITERLNSYQLRIESATRALQTIELRAQRLHERLALAEQGLSNFAQRSLTVLLGQREQRLKSSVERLENALNHKLAVTAQRLKMQEQRLEIGEGFDKNLPSFFNSKLLHHGPERVSALVQDLSVVVERLDTYQERLASASALLESCYENKIAANFNQRHSSLLSLITKLEGLNPLYQLERGLSLTTKDGKHSVKGEDIMVGDELVTILQGYNIYSRVTGVVPVSKDKRDSVL